MRSSKPKDPLTRKTITTYLTKPHWKR